MNERVKHAVNLSSEDYEKFRGNMQESKTDDLVNVKRDSEELIPQVIRHLDKLTQNNWGKPVYVKLHELRKEFGFSHNDPYFRKLIQYYREHANEKIFTEWEVEREHIFWEKGISKTRKETCTYVYYGMIIADNKGYAFTRSTELIEHYMGMVEEMKNSKNRQLISGEIIIRKIHENEQYTRLWQNQRKEGTTEHE